MTVSVGEPPWREALLQRLLAVTTVVGTATLGSAFLASPPGMWRSMLPVVPLLGLLGVATFRPVWPYRLRGGAIVLAFMAASLLSYSHVGFHGNGPLVGAGAVITAALLFGRKQALAVLALMVAGVALAALGMVKHILTPRMPSALVLTSPTPWIRTSLVATFLWVLLAFAVTYAVQHIENAARAAHDALAALREEQARREEAEKQRRDAERIAQQAQKLEVVGRLAAGVAHDFNNLLAVVQCWAELGAKPGADDARRAEARASILAASSQGAALARQLLTIGRGGARSVRDVVVEQAVDSALFVLRRVLPEDIEVVVEHGGGALVRADEMDLQQVALNFIVNARDAMPGGGRLRVTTGVREVASEELLVAGKLTAGRWAFLAVQDTGPGVDLAAREHIFEPFFTTKPAGSGTGLGLATVLFIARECGGAVGLDSEPGKGARFTFFLPAVVDSVAEAAVSAPPRAAPARNANILVVEDDAAIRPMMKSILEEQGHRVFTASDGDHALQLVADEKLDLLCTDGVLPGRSAPAVIAAFEAAHPERPVLVVSGHVQEELTMRGIGRGRYRLLHKPFTVGDLSAAVNELLGGPQS